MGVKINGVRRAIPQRPNFDFTFMAILVVLLNIFLGLLPLNLAMSLVIISPPYTTKKTVSIMPKDEKMLVSHQLSLKATPANGPPTNFIVAAKATAKYSEIFNIYPYQQLF